MSTPKGGQYCLSLPDGSKVWLNAASSIKFPVAFTGKERKVWINGEAYFEVARNKQKPFIVAFDETEVKVLGTSFNVSSYNDESVNVTTLIEGSVSVQTAKDELILKPGEQATGKGNLKLNTKANIEQVMAWRNGAFDFNDQDFVACMRQLERWYDIRVVYDGPKPTAKFLGEVDRNLTLTQVLKVLEGVTAKFRLEGRTLHVRPKT